MRRSRSTARKIVIHQGDRRYRARALEKNLSYQALRVNLLVSRQECARRDRVPRGHVRSVRGATAHGVHQAGERRAGREGRHDPPRPGPLCSCSWRRCSDEQIKKTLKPEEKETGMSRGRTRRGHGTVARSAPADRILEDFEQCGVVGEETNKKVSYLAAVSRLSKKPLAIVVQSSSSAGKSSLMEAVLDFVPEEQRESYSAMTGQSLFYMGEKNLKHKILAVAEEEGAQRAAYALKLLQSEGVLKIASTGKDPVSGKLVTHEYHGRRPGDDLPHHHGAGRGRGVAESLHRAHGERGAGADAGDSSQAARGADARRHVGTARSARRSSSCIATRNACCGRMRVVNDHVREQTFPDAHDPHAARSPEVPDADRSRLRCCISTSGRSRPARARAKRWNTSRPRRTM